MGSIYEPPAKTALEVVNGFEPEITLSKPKPITPGRFDSLYEWWGTRDFTQSMKIKSGIVCQELIAKLVDEAPIKPTAIVDEIIKVAKGNKSKEADIIISIDGANTEREIIVYREVKTNMNLDSEKMPASIEKIEQITDALQRKHPDSVVSGKFLCPTRLESDEDMIEGLNDFLDLLGYVKLSVDEFNQIGTMMGTKLRALLDN